jgi:hypothetical protein
MVAAGAAVLFRVGRVMTALCAFGGSGVASGSKTQRVALDICDQSRNCQHHNDVCPTCHTPHPTSTTIAEGRESHMESGCDLACAWGTRSGAPLHVSAGGQRTCFGHSRSLVVLDVTAVSCHSTYKRENYSCKSRFNCFQDLGQPNPATLPAFCGESLQMASYPGLVTGQGS